MNQPLFEYRIPINDLQFTKWWFV